MLDLMNSRTQCKVLHYRYLHNASIHGYHNMTSDDAFVHIGCQIHLLFILFFFFQFGCVYARALLFLRRSFLDHLQTFVVDWRSSVVAGRKWRMTEREGGKEGGWVGEGEGYRERRKEREVEIL